MRLSRDLITGFFDCPVPADQRVKCTGALSESAEIYRTSELQVKPSELAYAGQFYNFKV